MSKGKSELGRKRQPETAMLSKADRMKEVKASIKAKAKKE